MMCTGNLEERWYAILNNSVKFYLHGMLMIYRNLNINNSVDPSSEIIYCHFVNLVMDIANRG